MLSLQITCLEFVLYKIEKSQWVLESLKKKWGGKFMVQNMAILFCLLTFCSVLYFRL
jgi:hypothetical protein